MLHHERPSSKMVGGIIRPGAPLRPPTGNGVINGTTDDANIICQKRVIIRINVAPPSSTASTKPRRKRKRKRKRNNNKNDRLCSMATRQTYTLGGGWEPTVEETPPDDSGDENVGKENKKKLTATDDKKMTMRGRVIAKCTRVRKVRHHHHHHKINIIAIDVNESNRQCNHLHKK